MKTILLVIALVAKADAPKAGLQKAAVAPAAAASVEVLPTASVVQPAELAVREVGGATGTDSAGVASRFKLQPC